MPYDVSGWIEVLWDWTLEEEKQLWSGVINLDRFMLSGDIVSNMLFGLAKRPVEQALFLDRRIPDDCSDLVRAEVIKNNNFIAKYGEGDFSHTYATWFEIKQYIEIIDIKDIAKSEWKVIFNIVEILVENKIKPEWIRLVVWANW